MKKFKISILMNSKNQIQLEATSILSVPIYSYEKDFTFIVNDKEFKTSRLLSDLLSPKISQAHLIDPTIDVFCIRTQSKGNFQHILDLYDFQPTTLSEDEVPFFSEIIEFLESKSIKLITKDEIFQLTTDNIFSQIKKHEKYDHFYSENLTEEIDFISSHFYELFDDNNSSIETFLSLTDETIEKVINNSKLKLKDEDQLISVINELSKSDTKFSSLYEFVIFCNVSSSKMTEFVDLFDINEISSHIWRSLSFRLKKEIKEEVMQEENENHRYIGKVEKELSFAYDGKNEFCGIIRHLMNESNGQIENKIDITSSLVNGEYFPKFAISFDDTNKFFQSKSQLNGWICFDFKEHQIVPTNYTIRSYFYSPHYLKSWNLEGSQDKAKWEVIDSQTNCTHIDGSLKVHTFPINKESQKKFRYFRIVITGCSQTNSIYYCLTLNSFELYGKLI